MVRPEGVRVIAYVPEAFRSVGILKDGFEGISAYAGSGESRVAEGLDIDNAYCLRGKDEYRQEGEGSIAAETFALKVQIDRA